MQLIYGASYQSRRDFFTSPHISQTQSDAEMSLPMTDRTMDELTSRVSHTLLDADVSLPMACMMG